MNVKDIISRNNITQDEAMYVIGEYIYERKGVRVSPVIETRLGQAYALHQIKLMNQAYDRAFAWYT